MNKEHHKNRAVRMLKKIDNILMKPDNFFKISKEETIDLVYRASRHLVAYGLQRKYGKHCHSFVRLRHLLHSHGETTIVELLDKLEDLKEDMRINMANYDFSYSVSSNDDELLLKMEQEQVRMINKFFRTLKRIIKWTRIPYNLPRPNL